MRFRAAVLVFLTVAGGGVACGGQSSDVKPERCAPVDPVSMAGVGAESLEGDYELVLVATVGDSAGNSAEGRLGLYSNEPSLRSIPSAGGGVRTDASAPLHGATDVDVEKVGGLRLGASTSRDPSNPGVLVVEQGEQIVLRLGSEANRRGVLRFDGGYFALWVHQVHEGGFAGRWTSGILGVQAEGHFCASRLGD